MLETTFIVIAIIAVLVWLTFFKKYTMPEIFEADGRYDENQKYLKVTTLDLSNRLKRAKKTPDTKLRVRVVSLGRLENICYCDDKIRMFVEVVLCPNFTGEILPDYMETLEVDDCPKFSGGGLKADELESLIVKKSNEFIGNAIPRDLKALDVSDCPVFVGMNLPPTIEKLTIENCPKFVASSVPRNVHRLNVGKLPYFFSVPLESNVKELYVDMCAGFTLKKVPSSVTKLILSKPPEEMQLPDIPDSVHELIYCDDVDYTEQLSHLGFEPDRSDSSTYYRKFRRPR